MPKQIFDTQKNAEERMNFVDYWAEYVRTHTDKEWGSQQAVLINSQSACSSRVMRKSGP